MDGLWATVITFRSAEAIAIESAIVLNTNVCKVSSHLSQDGTRAAGASSWCFFVTPFGYACNFGHHLMIQNCV
jgi:hypothetical protein